MDITFTKKLPAAIHSAEKQSEVVSEGIPD